MAIQWNEIVRDWWKLQPVEIVGKAADAGVEAKTRENALAVLQGRAIVASEEAVRQTKRLAWATIVLALATVGLAIATVVLAAQA